MLIFIKNRTWFIRSVLGVVGSIVAREGIGGVRHKGQEDQVGVGRPLKGERLSPAVGRRFSCHNISYLKGMGGIKNYINNTTSINTRYLLITSSTDYFYY